MKTQSKPAVVAAYNIEFALNGDKCPYCGLNGKVSTHIKECKERDKNIAAAAKLKTARWAMHKSHGKVLILDHSDGLCLIESESGRYVSAASLLVAGQLSPILKAIESTELSDEEIDELVRALRIKIKDYTKLSKLPELWPGCQIEIQMGEKVHKATVNSKMGSVYVVTPDGRDSSLNVSPKQIIRLL